MNTRKKFWWAIGALAITLVVAGASVGITLAAISANVNSNFNISYTAKNVEAVVSGSYSNSDKTQSGTLGEDLVFNGKEVNKKEMPFSNSPNVTLVNENDFLEFQFKVKNTGKNGFGVTLSLEMTGEQSDNFQVVYSTSYRKDDTTDAMFSYTDDATTFEPAYVTATGMNKAILDIGVKITLVDALKSSAATGTFELKLDSLAEEPFETGGTSTLLPGSEFSKLFPNAYSISFGNLTAKDQYIVDGVNKIASPLSVTPASLDGRTKIYEVKNEIYAQSSDFYVLAPPDCKIFLNENSSGLFAAVTANEINGLTILDTSQCTDMSFMFSYCRDFSDFDYRANTVTRLDVSGWDTSHVTNMSGTFFMNEGLYEIKGLETWNTSSVTKMDGMFACNISLGSLAGIANWDVSHVITFSRYVETPMPSIFGREFFKLGMFTACRSLTMLDLSGWHTSSATDMRSMFSSCDSLNVIAVGEGWDLSHVTNENSEGMFGTDGGWLFWGSQSKKLRLYGTQGTGWSEDNPTDKTYAKVDEAESGSPGYFWQGPLY